MENKVYHVVFRVNVYCVRMEMDVFKVEPLEGGIGSPPPADKLSPEVSFDAGSEFNLSFFDQPEDGSTQGGFSDPGSVGSASASSPPPSAGQITSIAAPAGLLLGSPGGSTITIKQGISKVLFFGGGSKVAHNIIFLCQQY